MDILYIITSALIGFAASRGIMDFFEIKRLRNEILELQDSIEILHTMITRQSDELNMIMDALPTDSKTQLCEQLSINKYVSTGTKLHPLTVDNTTDVIISNYL